MQGGIRGALNRRADSQLRILYTRLAVQAYDQYQESLTRHRPDGTRGRNEWIDGGYVISVTDSYSRDNGTFTTDVIIAPRDHSGQRLHVVFDGQGNQILNEWHGK